MAHDKRTRTTFNSECMRPMACNLVASRSQPFHRPLLAMSGSQVCPHTAVRTMSRLAGYKYSCSQ
eukprot:13288972-Alexandrium_andersonii.AAC.1